MFTKNLEERINKALEIAWRYGQIDGGHHKMWVIDQMVRALCEDDEAYKEWVKNYQTPLSYGEYYEWHKGVAP